MKLFYALTILIIFQSCSFDNKSGIWKNANETSEKNDGVFKEFEKLSSVNRENLEPIIKTLIEKHKTNFKGVGQPLRIGLVGSRFGPGLYDVIMSLDKAEVVKRLSNI